jgi:hypothetical protein
VSLRPHRRPVPPGAPSCRYSDIFSAPPRRGHPMKPMVATTTAIVTPAATAAMRTSSGVSTGARRRSCAGGASPTATAIPERSNRAISPICCAGEIVPPREASTSGLFRTTECPVVRVVRTADVFVEVAAGGLNTALGRPPCADATAAPPGSNTLLAPRCARAQPTYEAPRERSHRSSADREVKTRSAQMTAVGWIADTGAGRAFRICRTTATHGTATTTMTSSQRSGREMLFVSPTRQWLHDPARRSSGPVQGSVASRCAGSWERSGFGRSRRGRT